jgi:hypothetical protein
MHKHLVLLRKSTFKDQGAAAMKRLIGTPAELVFREAGVTHPLGPLFRGP